jgi:hypothetical protein
MNTLHRSHGKHLLYCCSHHRLRRSVFTEPLFRNGLHNPVVPPLFGASDMINILVLFGRKPVLAPETENQLHECCCNVKKTLYWLTVGDFTRMAYHWGGSDNALLWLSVYRTQKEGGDYACFWRGIRKYQPLTISTIRSIMRKILHSPLHFLHVKSKAPDVARFSASGLFSVDETSVTTVQIRNRKANSLKVKCQVQKRFSA